MSPAMMMVRRLPFATLLLVCVLVPRTGQAQAAAAPAAPPTLDLAQWEPDIRAFEEADRQTSPPRDGVLLVGSSSIRFWKSAAEDFPGLPVLNRGFGGSQVREVTAFADRIVLPYRPRVILFYCGPNDVFGGRPVPAVVTDTEAFIRKVHAALPATRVIYISVAPNPARWHLKDAWLELNARMQAFAATDPRVTFVDVWSAMLDAAGHPRPDLFVEDRLHMNERGYAIWTRILRPIVQREFSAAASRANQNR
jgi:lysophospholipase L1-like esterase